MPTLCLTDIPVHWEHLTELFKEVLTICLCHFNTYLENSQMLSPISFSFSHFFSSFSLSFLSVCASVLCSTPSQPWHSLPSISQGSLCRTQGCHRRRKPGHSVNAPLVFRRVQEAIHRGDGRCNNTVTSQAPVASCSAWEGRRHWLIPFCSQPNRWAIWRQSHPPSDTRKNTFAQLFPFFFFFKVDHLKGLVGCNFCLIIEI